MPVINNSYLNYNSNKGDLIILSLFPEKALSVAYEVNWLKIKYPCIPDAGSLSITYGVLGTPWLILIAPNKQIVEKDIYPISNLNNVIAKYSLATPIVNKQEYANNEIACKLNKDKLDITVKKAGNYSISLYSLNGRLSNRYSNIPFSTGTHSFNLEPKHTIDQCCIVEITSGNILYRQKVTAY